MEPVSIQTLQEKYPVFSFDSYNYDLRGEELILRFSFHCGEHSFVTTDTLSGVTKEMLEKIEKDLFDQYVFQLGMAEIASYWKAFCSPTIAINCGSLDTDQTAFWRKLFFHGMGEFFYVNQIKPFSPELSLRGAIHQQEDRDVAISWGSSRQTATHLAQNDKKKEPILVPVGGGKDSIVTLELLANHGYPIYTWSGLKGASPQVIDLFGMRHPRLGDIIFGRDLDPKLFELNAQGHPNGHTPFSSVLAFFTLLTARLYEIPTIAVSNEGSSNEATGSWMGIDVNHQYSKSLQFEEDFQNYVIHTFGSSAPHYFSFLRPLDELAIMKIFVSYTQYFPVFHSCNVGQKTNTWCGKCAKCVFVALLLSAYLDDTVITSIFGTNILADASLTPLVDALIGRVEFKPFECVGTRSESIRALQMAIGRRKDSLPALLLPYTDLEDLPSSQPLVHHLRDEFITILAPYV